MDTTLLKTGKLTDDDIGEIVTNNKKLEIENKQLKKVGKLNRENIGEIVSLNKKIEIENKQLKKLIKLAYYDLQQRGEKVGDDFVVPMSNFIYQEMKRYIPDEMPDYKIQ